MSAERLIYLPLGGAGEIGMNAYLYGYGPKGKERFIVVDLGVTFPDMDSTPGVDLIMADTTWLQARRDRIDAIFITHAHMDHIGAVGLLWDKLRAPIYARKFTAAVARDTLDEVQAPDSALIVAEAWPAQIQAGAFKVGFVPISHSIPESSAMVIDTPAGRIVHSGDFKIDETPVVGEAFDRALFRQIGDAGVKVLVCDSTNVFSPHPGRSEAGLVEPISKLIAAAPGMVAATTFGSNVARLKTLADAGRAAGREICLLGRAMRNMTAYASKTGLLPEFPPTLSPDEALEVPRRKLMLLVTGSQGERRAASAQLAQGSYLGLKMEEGDLFLFSSKVIPGNERGVIKIINQFSEKGVDIVDGDDGHYHVSGHANRPDLAEMHELIRPKVVIPMHGEHRHLRAHARLAREAGRASIVATNGMMLDLTGDTPVVAEYVEAGRSYLDGRVMVGSGDGVVRDRIRMALNGHVTVTMILDEQDEPLGEPWVETMGLPEKGRSKASLIDVLEADLDQFVKRAQAKTLKSDEKLDKDLRTIVRKATQDEVGKKPEVTVVVSRLG